MPYYKVIGQMSGTSLDGVDLAYCTFEYNKEKWHFTIEQSQTIPYSNDWHRRLATVENGNALEFVKLDADYACLLTGMIKQFIAEHQLSPDFVSMHGHTVFHQPAINLTTQIGCGATLAAQLHLPVICDFRTQDVALGGQGAPLVPVGDALLFSDYTFCLNLGGFSNISYQDSHNRRIAFDICPVNIVLNYFAQKTGMAYDKDGLQASQGKIHAGLLDKLNSLDYYKQSPPKSLGKEWVLSEFLPLIDAQTLSMPDILATLCEHIAIQISRVINEKSLVDPATVLVTGGGVYNQFLIRKIQEKTFHQLIIPKTSLVDFKEALIFAFLGVLRKEELDNCLQSVTGANRSHCSGAVYL